MISAAPQRHLYLIGFMGTGKSAVGAPLSIRLKRHFIDLDEMVSAMQRRPVRDIFRLDGEERFRIYEARALRLVAAAPRMVIALGGGAPTIVQVANIARQTGRTVWLTARWELIWERVRHDLESRPLLEPLLPNTSAVDDQARFRQFQTLAEPLYRQRESAYAAMADLVIDTSDRSVEDVVDQIAALCREWFPERF